MIICGIVIDFIKIDFDIDDGYCDTNIMKLLNIHNQQCKYNHGSNMGNIGNMDNMDNMDDRYHSNDNSSNYNVGITNNTNVNSNLCTKLTHFLFGFNWFNTDVNNNNNNKANRTRLRDNLILIANVLRSNNNNNNNSNNNSNNGNNDNNNNTDNNSGNNSFFIGNDTISINDINTILQV